MADKIEYSRMLVKRTAQTGEVPTVPPLTATTLNQMIPTDLFVGELFLNDVDDLLWIRTDNGILPISLSGSTGTTVPNLTEVLFEGNSTNGYNIDVSIGDTIIFNGLSSGVTSTFLGLDASGNTITTVGGSGGGDLETTLGLGNTTGPNDIIFTQGYRVEGALGKGYFEPEGADESIQMVYNTTGATGSVNINEDTLIISYNNQTQTSTIETDGNYITMGGNGGTISSQFTGASSGLTINKTTGFPLYINNLSTGTSVNSLAITALNEVIIAPAAINGTNGTSGTSGAAGDPGTNGTSGTSGAAGDPGTSGTSGTNGTSGTSGVSGATGSSGTSGTSGVSGETGTSGTNGTSGTSGVSGATGSSGTSGLSGVNGTGSTLTGGTFVTSGGTLTLDNSNGSSVVVTGFTYNIGCFGLTIDGGGSAITTGIAGSIIVPYACVIDCWGIIADQSGSTVVDVWKGGSPLSIPTSAASSIAGSEKPTLSSQQINTDLNLTTWTKNLVFGDVLVFNVDSASTVTRVTLQIKVIKL